MCAFGQHARELGVMIIYDGVFSAKLYGPPRGAINLIASSHVYGAGVEVRCLKEVRRHYLI